MARRPTRQARRLEALATLSPAEQADARGLLLRETGELLAFHKPSGLLSEGGIEETPSLERYLSAFARSNGKRPVLLHRLDRLTSGVILAARTRPAAAAYGELFARRQVKKLYLALVTGPCPDWRCRTVTRALRIVRDETGARRTVVSSAPHREAKPAETRFRVLHWGEGAGLLAVRPLTGRTHQIRVHAASLGLPVQNDPLYGEDRGGVFGLHAARLVLAHRSGGILRFGATPGADFTAALHQIGGSSS